MEKVFLKSPAFDPVPVQDWMVLGRDPECALTFAEATVSARHARIERRDNQWILRDLRSEHGTWINNAQITEAVLKPGDWIRLGEAEMQFEPAAEAFPMSSRNELWNQTLQQLTGVARADYAVLLLGPSGTGKDVLAQNLHAQSSRAAEPFISVNCSALTETLVESELFGHVKGSFTGAISDRKGAFEAARGGTLFLDEIGDLPLPMQAKLLRALENQEIRPVGSDRTVKTDVRIIAATHQDLADRIGQGLFRADLYYRLNVVTVHLPPLRSRMEDFEDLLYGFCKAMRVRFSIAAIQQLKSYTWPGNIRELRNLVARASALYPQQSIEVEHVIRLITGAAPGVAALAASSGGEQLDLFAGAKPARPVIEEIEKQIIIKRLRANRGNQRRTAGELGLPKSTLFDRIRAYGIDIAEFKAPMF